MKHPYLLLLLCALFCCFGLRAQLWVPEGSDVVPLSQCRISSDFHIADTSLYGIAVRVDYDAAYIFDGSFSMQLSAGDSLKKHVLEMSYYSKSKDKNAYHYGLTSINKDFPLIKMSDRLSFGFMIDTVAVASFFDHNADTLLPVAIELSVFAANEKEGRNRAEELTLRKEYLIKRHLHKAYGDDKAYSLPISVWPNPADELLNIELESEMPFDAYHVLYVYDADGKVVLTQNQFKQKVITLNVSSLSAGLYFAQLYFKEKANWESYTWLPYATKTFLVR